MSDFSLKSVPAHPARNHVDALDGMQKDMLEALHDDQVKKQLNDAKIRAVKQRVEYDEFEKLVMGAHLKPIKPRSDTLTDIGKNFDGFVLPKHEAVPAGPAPPPKAAVAPTESVPPPAKTSNEFARVWKRQCKTAAVRRAYLQQLDPDTLPLIFRTELDPSLFDGFVATLGEACFSGATSAPAVAPAAGDGAEPASSTAPVVDLSDLDGVDAPADAPKQAVADGPRAELAWASKLLSGISRLNRFDLTLDFADKATLETLAKLFDAMAAGGIDSADVVAMRAAYKA